MTKVKQSLAFALLFSIGCGDVAMTDAAQSKFDDGQSESEVVESEAVQPETVVPVVEQQQLDVVAPLGDGACRKIGEKIQLEVAVKDPTMTRVTWMFRSDAPDCPWINVASDNMPSHTAMASSKWDTSCARDIPNGCGFGSGILVVETFDAAGTANFGFVNFCLQPSTPGL